MPSELTSVIQDTLFMVAVFSVVLQRYVIKMLFM